MEQLKEKPYIGVTGVTLPSQAETITQTFTVAGLTEEQSSHKGMIGVLVSQRSLSPEFQGRVKYPTLDQTRRIFEKTKGLTFNTLHYHTYQEPNLAKQVGELLDRNRLYADRLCTGVQLNIAWPDPKEVEKIKRSLPDLKLILQLGPRVLTESPAEIAKKLTPYIDITDYALIDPSGGRGQTFQVNTIVPTFNHVRRSYPDLPLVFAGGFDADNVKRRLWLLFQAVGTSQFSIDAETGLRVQHKNRQKPSPLSITRTRRYIQNAQLFFSTLR